MWPAVIVIVAIVGVHNLSHKQEMLAHQNKVLKTQLDAVKKQTVKPIERLDGVQITNLSKTDDE